MKDTMVKGISASDMREHYTLTEVEVQKVNIMQTIFEKSTEGITETTLYLTEPCKTWLSKLGYNLIQLSSTDHYIISW